MPTKFDFLSPGIQINEIDESVLPADVIQPGPIIIGRTAQGPALKPVRINTLADYINVFGAPIAGGSSITGDIWRDGPGSTAPTYASYAAQSWLASQTTGITVVRLLGDEVDSPVAGATRVGWTLSGSAANAASGSNSTAYGLFVVPSASAASNPTGSLAAVFYVNQGYITLSGSTVAGAEVNQSLTLVYSQGSNYEFKMGIYDESGVKEGSEEFVTFNFNRNGPNYIRKAFNTNPILTTDEDVVSDGNKRKYWLGETFQRHLEKNVTNSDTGKCYAFVAPLEHRDSSLNWSDRTIKMKPAKSGMIISDRESGQKDLFRVEMLHEGGQPQKNIMIAIEEIKPSTNPTVSLYGTFTLRVTNLSGQTLETYRNLTFDERSPDFISKRIGDQVLSWKEDKRRYNIEGDNPNVSSYIRVILEDDIPENALPFGFKGPGRPKGFSFSDSSTDVFNLGTTNNFANAFVKPTGSVPEGHSEAMAFGGLEASYAASIEFPSIPMRNNGSEGYPASQLKAYYGIMPKISANSSTNDPDYIDYLRGIPGADYDKVFNPSGEYEHSTIFTLDDLVIDASNNVTWTSGSYSTTPSSYSKASGSFELLNKGTRQFYVPVFGGFDGLSVRTKEPFNNNLLSTSDTNSNNALHYSLFKAIDTVSDSEVSMGNILLAPGFYKTHITDKLIATCEARQDALAIIDLENDYKPKYEEAASSSEESLRGDVDAAVTSLKNRNLNSSYACAFYPRVQIADILNNNQRVWIPSSIAGLGAMARTEATSELWFAPAGFNRGGLGNLGGSAGPLVIQARQRLDVTQRDDLYAQGINPIASFPNEGVVIFGQKTLQKANSALDRINVRRLMIFLKHEVGEVAKTTLFQPNVQATWNSFKSRVEPILSDVQSRFGITEYRLILDESTTTPDLIDRNILYAKIFLKPARAIEFIAIDFVITKSGAELV